MLAEEMQLDSRETSPDPIVLPSSPLSGRKLRTRTARKRASTPQKSRLSQQQTRATPTKEIILDTPQLGITNDGSPWRIKVTVQAEQRKSPGKMVTRTTSVPLLNSPSQRKRSASPVKRRKATPRKTVQQDAEAEVEVKKRGRKRKGTPLMEKSSAPHLRARQSLEEVQQEETEAQPEGQQDEQDEQDLYGEAAALEAEQAMQVLDSESNTPPNHRRASGRLARLNAQWSDGTGRTKRLSRAREELDEALQDAVGDGHGDLTLSRAEDFTMVSLESLQTTKEASLLHNSQLSRSHLSTVREAEGEKSALSVSYLPSSPPKGQTTPQFPDLGAAKMKSTVLSPWQPLVKRLTAQTTLQSPFEPTSSTKKKSGLRESFDAMSWQPDSPAGTRPFSSTLHRSQPVLHTPLGQSANISAEPRRQWQREREAVNQHSQQAISEDAITADDDEHVTDTEVEGDGGGDGADMWQTAASREIERPETGAIDDPALESQRSERVEDLFAHLPLKPARPKIPRTWRRSSGMDFSYIDSPAHLPLAEPTNDRRQSTDGSGVLTPPSTDCSEEEEEEEEETAGTVDLQGGADDQLQSEFTQPETEGTRYQDEDDDERMLDDEEVDDELQQDNELVENTDADDFEILSNEQGSAHRTKPTRDEEYVPSRNDSKSPLSEAESPDEADKTIARSMLPPSSRSTRRSQNRGSAFERGIMNGSFPSDVDFEPTRQRRPKSQAPKPSAGDLSNADAENNMSQVTDNNHKPRRRPPRRPTADLEELLGLASSPEKPLPKEIRVSAIGKPAQHLGSGSFSAQMMSRPLSARHVNRISKDSPSGGAMKQKPLSISTRKILANDSEISGSAPQTSDEDELSRPLQLERAAASAQAMFLSPPKLTHDPITGKLLTQPKRRGRRRKVGDEGQTESTVTDSFASKENEPTQRTESQSDTSLADSLTGKTSDQRQLLQESAVKRMAQPAVTNWSRELQSSAIKRKELHLQRQAEELAAESGGHDRPSTGTGHRDYAQPQSKRQQVQVAHPDDEHDDFQSAKHEESHVRGHHRIISAVDSNTELPDAEGTHAQMEDVSYEDEHSYEDESTAQPDHVRSYEENLNIDSPTKVRVNFNDTMSFSSTVDQTSSWLVKTRRGPTLFDTNAPVQELSQPKPDNDLGIPPHDDLEHVQLAGTGFIGKITTTLWNAVVRPQRPTEVSSDPKAQATDLIPVTQQLQNLGDDSFILTLRAQLRSRYGVLSECYPWTMAHQRTLHRMLNSVCSGRPDTLLPRKGRLPRELEKTINEICSSVTGFEWVFTKEQAYIVHSFMHTLVSEELINDMRNGDVEFIGDETAMAIRGYLDPERHGDDCVWRLKRGHPESVVGYVDNLKGKMMLGFVIKALGDCILSNEVLRKRLNKEGREEDFEKIAYGIEVR